MNQNFKVLSLFSSAGIGELGIEAAGLSILVSNELLQNRCDLYRENYPNVDNICGDIWEKEEDIIDRCCPLVLLQYVPLPDYSCCSPLYLDSHNV